MRFCVAKPAPIPQRKEAFADAKAMAINMNIQGLQKLTLLDYPGHVACTVFSGGCNFRCPFCHNALLVTRQSENASNISEDDFFAFLKKRQGILDGVCLTGGEPLLDPDVFDFIRKIKELGYKVKLDTNGSFPERLLRLVDENLVDYVAMDIKNTLEKYGATVGLEKYDTSKIQKSIEILKSGKVDFEFRTTLVKEFHTQEDLESIGKLLQGAEKYFLQKFTDSGNLICDGLSEIDKKDACAMLEAVKKYIPAAELRGY